MLINPDPDRSDMRNVNPIAWICAIVSAEMFSVPTTVMKTTKQLVKGYFVVL